jgi:nicotinamide mononucleotide transporter
VSLLEIVAAFLGVANVYLITRRSMFNWPIGILLTILYTWIFFDAKLYADTVTQIFFTVVQVFGWYAWYQNREDEGEVTVVKQKNGEYWLSILGLVVIWAASSFFFSTYTDAAFPTIDSIILAGSVIGQFLLNARRIEAWMYWIGIDVIAIPLYYIKGLYPTSALYVIFLGLAVYGLVKWDRKYMHQKEEEKIMNSVASALGGAEK